jgi:hypothetical protein
LVLIYTKAWNYIRSSSKSWEDPEAIWEQNCSSGYLLQKNRTKFQEVEGKTPFVSSERIMAPFRSKL